MSRFTTTVVNFLVILLTYHNTSISFHVFAESKPLHCSADNRPISMHAICDCPRAKESLKFTINQTMSSCSDHATARGPKQNVVSFSFYGSLPSGYFNDTEQNIQRIAEVYPGWIMRLYHNMRLRNSNERQAVCRLWCAYPHFDVCNVNSLPPPLCNQSKVFGMMWRFFVLGDALVDRFMVRDLDSIISSREIAAVKVWLKSGKTYHMMRDHPYHTVVILGGMWGGANWNLSQTTTMRTLLIQNGDTWLRNHDQRMLSKIVWNEAKHDAIVHDSYQCDSFGKTEPWPTRRENNSHYVGKATDWKVPEYLQTVPECPVKCRPKKHLDWIYC